MNEPKKAKKNLEKKPEQEPVFYDDEGRAWYEGPCGELTCWTDDAIADFVKEYDEAEAEEDRIF